MNKTAIFLRTGRKNVDGEEIVAGIDTNGDAGELMAYAGIANKVWGVRILSWFPLNETDKAVKLAEGYVWGDKCCGGEVHCCWPAGTPG